jgi:hypothetical protein
MFISSRSRGTHWESLQLGFSTDFVEWVEEQRAKAA